jgi:TPR repeat protein
MKAPTLENNTHRTLAAALRELCHFLTTFPRIQMSEDECEALAVAAVSGHAEAEFMVASVYDAAGEDERAMEWYSRAAQRKYLPAMLQLLAVR